MGLSRSGVPVGTLAMLIISIVVVILIIFYPVDGKPTTPKTPPDFTASPTYFIGGTSSLTVFSPQLGTSTRPLLSEQTPALQSSTPTIITVTVVITPTLTTRVNLRYPLDKHSFGDGCRGVTFEWDYPWHATFAIVFYHKAGAVYELVENVGARTNKSSWTLSTALPNGEYKWRIDVLDQNGKLVVSSEEKSFICY